MKISNKILSISVAFCSIVCLLAACGEPSTYPEKKESVDVRYKSIDTVVCAYVSDGDTWNFYNNNVKYPVRVLDIDCFETSINDRLSSQAKSAGISEDSALALGLRAKAVADSILKGKTIIIQRTAAPALDVYNRLLRKCYVNNKCYDSIIKSMKLDVDSY